MNDSTKRVCVLTRNLLIGHVSSLQCAVAVALLAFPFFLRGAEAASIDTVLVANPGNAPGVEFNGSFGAVAYNYRIGKTEVTNTQYTEFLNMVDPSGANTLALYSTDQSSSSQAGGIDFDAGMPAGAKYTVQAGRGEAPIAFVSWYSAVRFANSVVPNSACFI